VRPAWDGQRGSHRPPKTGPDGATMDQRGLSQEMVRALLEHEGGWARTDLNRGPNDYETKSLVIYDFATAKKGNQVSPSWVLPASFTEPISEPNWPIRVGAG